MFTQLMLPIILTATLIMGGVMRNDVINVANIIVETFWKPAAAHIYYAAHPNG